MGDSITIAKPFTGPEPHDGENVEGWAKIDILTAPEEANYGTSGEVLRQNALPDPAIGYELEVVQVRSAQTLPGGSLTFYLRARGESGIFLFAAGHLYFPTTAEDISTVRAIVESIKVR